MAEILAHMIPAEMTITQFNAYVCNDYSKVAYSLIFSSSFVT